MSSGTVTILNGDSNLASNIVTAGPQTLKVTYDSGGLITVFINGVSRLSFTLSGADQTKFGPFTKVGMRLDAANLRYNNFSAG